MSRPGSYIFGCAGPDLSEEERTFFREAQPWGFILFARNVDTPDRLLRLTSDLRASVGRDAPILIDQEGGRVQRMGPPHWKSWLPPLEQVARCGPDKAARGMYLRYRLIAEELRRVGIDVNCVPDGDIALTETHPILRNRCYGDDPDVVIEVSRAVATGLMAGGVLPVVKHMPGHGRAKVDSHLETPRVGADPEKLERTDFAVFRALSDLPLGMSAHVVYETLDDRPGTISPRIVGLIRDGIGFDGLLMTDDISMEALGGTVAERGAAALDAGCDLVLHCNGDISEMESLADTLGEMTPAAESRGQRALRLRRLPEPIDIPALEAELEALLCGGGNDRG